VKGRATDGALPFGVYTEDRMLPPSSRGLCVSQTETPFHRIGGGLWRSWTCCMVSAQCPVTQLGEAGTGEYLTPGRGSV